MRWWRATPREIRKLDKAKAYGRIDVAVAAVKAVGAMKTSASAPVEVSALIA